MGFLSIELDFIQFFDDQQVLIDLRLAFIFLYLIRCFSLLFLKLFHYRSLISDRRVCLEDSVYQPRRRHFLLL